MTTLKRQIRRKKVAKRRTAKSVRQAILSSNVPNLRLFLVWGTLVLAAVGLGINLYRLQIVEASRLEKQARQQQMVYLRPYIPRRPIIDRQGNILATDRLVYTLYAHPKLFKVSNEEMAETLAPILATKTKEELLKRFNEQKSGIRLVYTLPEDTASRVSDLSLDGLELIQQYSRLYPQQEMAAEVLGYVDVYEHKGRAGVEFSQEQYLERSPLTLRLSRTGHGALLPDHLPEGFLYFDELQLQLTLDMRLQRSARLALKKQMAEYNAKRGTVIVMDVQDGSLLSLVSEPTYNPNEYYEADMALFKNWAVSDLYEPGSTFKPINIAIALEEGKIQPDETFYDSGRIYIDTWPISNHDYSTQGAHGTINVAQILQKSSNVGMVKIMQKLQPSHYYNWFKRLKLGETMGIDLRGEGSGQLKSKEQFTTSEIEPATTAFGQGFSLTPLKLAQLHAALANGGKLVTPHVVNALVDPQGQIHASPRHPNPTQVFSPNTTQTVLEMMETVVTDGSGEPAAIPGYRIAGKTGTAQKASPNGGYLPNAKITSFVGIVPVNAPRYVVVAVVDEPQKPNSFGSTVTAPIVKSVMETLLSLEGIPPTEEVEDDSASSP